MIIPAKEQTSAAVAQHYDDLDPFYRELWGDHVHHGLWTTGLENPAQAVENLIACVARHLELDPGNTCVMSAAAMGRRPSGWPSTTAYM